MCGIGPYRIAADGETMNRIDELQEKIVNDFQEMGDGFEQYAYLIELSVQLPGLAEDRKTEDRLVKGCQSHVWLDMRAENGVFDFDADSDTLILKGVLFLLRDIFGGQPLDAVANARVWFFENTEIMATFDADRQKGIGYIIRAMQSFAAEHGGK